MKADQFLRVDEPLRSAARLAGQEDAVEPLSSKIASVARSLSEQLKKGSDVLHGVQAMRRRWGMPLLVCCWAIVSWSQEPCTLPHDTDATVHQTPWETADAQGVLFLRDRNTHCALASFTQEIRTNPEAWQGHYHAGLAYLDLSDAQHAVKELQLAVGKAPARAEIRLALGIAQEALGETGQAETSYRTAYAMDPKSSEITRHLAAVLGKEQQRGAAITYWRE